MRGERPTHVEVGRKVVKNGTPAAIRPEIEVESIEESHEDVHNMRKTDGTCTEVNAIEFLRSRRAESV